MLDRQASLTMVQSVGPAAITASTNGTSVDLAIYDGATAYVLAGTKTDGTHTPKLQDSPDNSTWTDVAAANLIGSFAAIATNTNQKVGYTGANRYLRGVTTVSGATTGAVYAIYIACQQGRKLPQGA
jgi:hypothetical protein